MKIQFSKVSEGAIIPSKREEDAGYDLYACFEADCVVIRPHTCMFVSTGIATAFDNDYVALLRERGSTGSKQMALRCGVIDAGFRGEWKVAINNTSNVPIYIMKKDSVVEIEDDAIVYPYEKAIAQFILTDAYHAEVEVIPYTELKEIKSERGSGMLGSSGA